MAKVTAGKHWLSDDDAYSNEVGRGAVSDNNEVGGMKREEAHRSPFKRKQQANNNVCPVFSLLC
jgi:hypothetical protein